MPEPCAIAFDESCSLAGGTCVLTWEPATDEVLLFDMRTDFLDEFEVGNAWPVTLEDGGVVRVRLAVPQGARMQDGFDGEVESADAAERAAVGRDHGRLTNSRTTFANHTAVRATQSRHTGSFWSVRPATRSISRLQCQQVTSRSPDARCGPSRRTDAARIHQRRLRHTAARSSLRRRLRDCSRRSSCHPPRCTETTPRRGSARRRTPSSLRAVARDVGDVLHRLHATAFLLYLINDARRSATL